MTEQKDKCPKCVNGIVQNWHKVGMDTMYSTDDPCPTCHGTGEKKLDSPDREEIAEKLYQQRWYEGQQTWEKSLLKDLFRRYADQIIALFPDDIEVEDEFVKAFAEDYRKDHEALHRVDIEEAKREERIEIGLWIQQQWSKVTSTKDYSPYKLVDFLGSVITELNKGQALKEEK